MITCPFDGCNCRIQDILILCQSHWRMLTKDERDELSQYRQEWSRGAMDFDTYAGFLKQFIADAHEREKRKLKSGGRP